MLGFSNRTVETAGLHAGGHAYLLIGVEPGSVTGVETIDPADLTNAITRYVGTDGPRWTLEHVSIESQTILVVIVDPPQRGDPPHTLRHRLANHQPGTVLIRRIGQTVQASPAEIAALVDRARATRDSLGVNVRAACSTIEGGFADIGSRLEDVLAAERQLLMRPGRACRPAERDEPDQGNLWLRGPVQVPSALRSMSSLTGPVYKPDERSEADYEQEANDYLTRLRDSLPRRLLYRRLNHLGASLRPTVDNLTERNFAQLRVRLHVPGAVRTWPDDLTDEVTRLADLPTRPRPLGAKVKVESSFDKMMAQGIYAPTLPMMPSFDNFRSPGFTARDIGSVEIEYDPIHLHPSSPEPLEAVPLLVDEPVGTELTVEWSATAENADKRVTGELTVVVVEPTLSLDTLPGE